IKILLRIVSEDLARNELRTVCRQHRIGLDDLYTITSHNAFAREARVLRQTDLHRVTTRCTNHRVRDAGVAAGGVENRHSGFELAASLALENHRKCGAIFYR